MAIEDAERTLIVRQIERTCRFDGYTPKGAQPFVVLHREVLTMGQDGELIGSPVIRSKQVPWSFFTGKVWNTRAQGQVSAEAIFEALSMAFDEASRG